MGHELAVEILNAPPESGLLPGETCVVNPYLSCGHCVACRLGKPNCCVNISVLGVHQDGGMIGCFSVPASNLIRAEGLSADESVTVEFLAIGAHAVRRSAATNRDRILVVGAGPIGLGIALFARLTGATVAVFDTDPERAAAAVALLHVDALTVEGSSVAEAARRLTAGEGFDLVFDATGSRRAMERGFDLVAHGGRYVLVGVVKEPVSFADPDFHRKEMTLLGSRNATNEDFQSVIAAIRGGEVPVDHLITHRTNLVNAAQEIPLWAKQKSGLIKAIIEFD
jgi:2-desacetyl-2-hydroxyethyl bacteriochlorophyllide A dehydrogenase